MKKITSLLIIILTLNSCNKDEISVFDEAFVHINFNNVSTAIINSNRKDIVSYYIYLSSKPLDRDMQDRKSVV